MRKMVTHSLLLSLGLAFLKPSLAGNVEHSGSLEPVHPMLRAGCQFDDRFLQGVVVDAKWFRIPKWFAGTWQRHKVSTKVLGFSVSQMDVRVRRYGFQTDAKGRVWHWVRTPFPVRTVRQNEICYFLIRKEEPISINKESVTLRMTWTAWNYDRATGIIKRVHQGDQVDAFRHKEVGVITCDSNLASYDQYGKYIGTAKVSWDDFNVEPYRPIDIYEGNDLRPMFYAFLEQQGLTDRIPEHETTRFDTGRSDWQE